jgi:hypothetical protein
MTETLTADEREAVRRGTCQASGPKAIRIIDALTARAEAAESDRDAARVSAAAEMRGHQRVAAALEHQQAIVERLDRAESEAAALRADVEQLSVCAETARKSASESEARALTAETDLAAANALLREVTGCVSDTLLERIEAHLDGKPAAHTWGSDPGAVRPDCGHQQPAAGECAWCLIDGAKKCASCGGNGSWMAPVYHNERVSEPCPSCGGSGVTAPPAALTRTERPMLTREDWFAADDRRRAEQRVLDANAQLDEEWLRKCEFSREMWLVNFARAELARRGLK